MLPIVRAQNEHPKDTSTGMLTMFSQMSLHEFTNYSQPSECRANLSAPRGETPPGPATFWIVLISRPTLMYAQDRPRARRYRRCPPTGNAPR